MNLVILIDGRGLRSPRLRKTVTNLLLAKPKAHSRISPEFLCKHPYIVYTECSKVGQFKLIRQAWAALSLSQNIVNVLVDRGNGWRDYAGASSLSIDDRVIVSVLPVHNLKVRGSCRSLCVAVCHYWVD